MGTHPATGEFYIGSRVANKEPPEIDLPKYKTSSKLVKPRFDDFDWKIVMVFSQKTCAHDYEQYLIYQELGNPLMLNRSCTYENKKRFTPIGTKRTPEQNERNRLAKIGNKNRLGKSVTEETKEKIRATLTGFKHSEEAKKNMSNSLKGNTNGTHLKGVKKPHGHAENVRQANIGMKVYNNGTVCVRTKEPPEGFVPGMLPRMKGL